MPPDKNHFLFLLKCVSGLDYWQILTSYHRVVKGYLNIPTTFIRKSFKCLFPISPHSLKISHQPPLPPLYPQLWLIVSFSHQGGHWWTGVALYLNHFPQLPQRSHLQLEIHFYSSIPKSLFCFFQSYFRIISLTTQMPQYYCLWSTPTFLPDID